MIVRRAATSTGAVIFICAFFVSISLAQSLNETVAQVSLQSDRMVIPDSVIQLALETSKSGVTTHWRIVRAAVSGEITPIRTFRRRDNSFCRDYRVMVETQGVPAVTRVERACRTASGWVAEG